MSASTSKKTFIGVACATAVVAAAAAVAVASGGHDRSPAPVASASAPAAPTTVGMVAAKDPATGKLTVPTTEQLSALQPPPAAVTKKTAPKISGTNVVRRLSNGGKAVLLDPSYDVASVAVKGPDGKLKMICVPAGQAQATVDAAQTQTMTTKEVLDEK